MVEDVVLVAVTGSLMTRVGTVLAANFNDQATKHLATMAPVAKLPILVVCLESFTYRIKHLILKLKKKTNETTQQSHVRISM